MIDFLGHFLRLSPHFPGRGRLTRYWLHRPRKSDRRQRILPGGAEVECDMSVPYEGMVWLGREEEEDLLALQRLLRPGQTFVDCGANIGLWSLVAANAVGPSGKVIAFEPNPRTCARLTANVERNDLFARVQIHGAGCGAKEGSLLLDCPQEHNNARLVTEVGPDTVSVPINTLDAVLGSSGVHGIKIDVEGHELAVLQGAAVLLRRERPWLSVEFNSQFASSPQLGVWEVHRYLSTLGYSACMFTDIGLSGVLSANWEVGSYANIFYWPSEIGPP